MSRLSIVFEWLLYLSVLTTIGAGIAVGFMLIVSRGLVRPADTSNTDEIPMSPYWLSVTKARSVEITASEHMQGDWPVHDIYPCDNKQAEHKSEVHSDGRIVITFDRPFTGNIMVRRAGRGCIYAIPRCVEAATVINRKKDK